MLCCAGTVTNVKEAVAWLGYTYLYVRMKKNPLSYGIAWEELAAEPDLISRRRQFISDAARELERCKMARFDERSGNLYVTDLGRVASHFYIRHDSIVTFNEHLKPNMTESEVGHLSLNCLFNLPACSNFGCISPGRGVMRFQLS